VTNVIDANSRLGDSQEDGRGATNASGTFEGSSVDRSSSSAWVTVTLSFIAVLLDGLDTDAVSAGLQFQFDLPYKGYINVAPLATWIYIAHMGFLQCGGGFAPRCPA
jgi:hypothetical protein